MDSIGKRLRHLRKERHLTLAQLGRQVSLSVSSLSQIERGAIMPSLSTLAAIARALAIDVRDIFEDEGAPPCVVRSGQGQVIRDASGLCVELLSADPIGKAISPYRVVCQPGAVYERASTYPEGGEECALVLSGRLTVEVGDETVVLRAGDSIHYQRHQPRSWRNEGQEVCVVIWAASPPPSEAELGR